MTSGGSRKRHTPVLVIGLSEGGVPVLRDLLNALPSGFPAVVCAVICGLSSRQKAMAIRHIAAGCDAVEPMNHQEMVPGRAYIAPDDHHLLIEDGQIELWHGPKENSQRPAVNALFRSAAISRTADVIGVVLSGTADDGATGLWWIKRYGGVAIVQDPRDAQFPAMPQHALETVDVDYCVPARDIPALLTSLVNGRAAGPVRHASSRG